MRVAIIGAGLAGVTSAYELALQRHEVHVFERDTSVATGASFAPPGLIAPGLMAARPGLPLAWRGKPRQLGWKFAHWRASRARGVQAMPETLHALALRGQAVMAVWRRELKMDVEREAGVLLLWRTAKDYKDAAPLLARLQERQVPHRELDAEGCRAQEPGLNAETGLHGGILLSQDEAANARQFSQALKLEAQRLGVQWNFNTDVLRIEPGSQPAVHVAAGDPLRVDAVLVCAGKGAASLLTAQGLKLPWGTVHTHTLTAPLRMLEAHPDLGPRATVIDMALGVTLTRLGQRVRVGGANELGGSSAQPDGQSMGTLHQAAHDWFPGALLAGGQQRWKTSRLLLPDELPLIGESGLPGVWLNIGHGEHGWTMAGAAAQLLAARLTKKDPGIDAALLEPGRLK
jgi:D-amino-acid dehydrogenase